MVNGSNIVPFPVGSKYMVVDAGGGTVDISVHEVMSGGKLKELHKACGGALGGTQVDEAYTQFIISLVGNHVFQRFCQESKEDHLEMFREFEIKKRGIAPNKDADVTIRFPAMLKDIFEDETNVDFNEAIKQTKYAKELTLMGDKLRVNASMIKNLFTDTINNIMSLVKQLLDDGRMQGISSILMVGGFSECEMLQHAMKSRFPSVSVIVPQEAGLVVLKGAVVFGHSPASITQRVCKYTYGIEAYDRFDDEIHDRKRLKIFGGLRWCEGVFCKHVEMGQVVTLNETTEAKPYWLINDQINEPLSIYYSTEKSPKYVTDKGCVKLGDISIDIIDRSVPLDQSSVLVFMAFGGTEIEVTAKEERTGRSTKAVVNFLE